MKDVSPGGKADFYLGMDQDVKVNHRLIKKEYLSEEGDRRTEIRYHYLISAENFKEREIRLSLKDRLPVSVMDDIDIYDVDIEPDEDSREENGMLAWNLQLQPKEKVEILLEYSVSFPGEWPEHTIMNLE